MRRRLMPKGTFKLPQPDVVAVVLLHSYPLTGSPVLSGAALLRR